MSQIGFLLDGSMAREYWFEFEEEQTHPDWLWLNGGFVLKSGEVFNPDDTARFSWQEPPVTFDVQLRYRGSNTPFPGTDPPATLDVQSSILRPVALLPAVYVSQRVLTPQPNNQVWQFDDYFEATSTGLVPPEGRAWATPLDACHGCVGNSP